MSLSWSSADGNDDPLEAAKDSVFVKILLKLIQEGEKMPAGRRIQALSSGSNSYRPLFEKGMKALEDAHVIISYLQKSSPKVGPFWSVTGFGGEEAHFQLLHIFKYRLAARVLLVEQNKTFNDVTFGLGHFLRQRINQLI